MKSFFEQVEKVELKYKGITGEATYSTEDDCFCGKIINTKDLVTFEAKTISDLETEFKSAVDEYIQMKRYINEIECL